MKLTRKQLRDLKLLALTVVFNTGLVCIIVAGVSLDWRLGLALFGAYLVFNCYAIAVQIPPRPGETP